MDAEKRIFCFVRLLISAAPVQGTLLTEGDLQPGGSFWGSADKSGTTQRI